MSIDTDDTTTDEQHINRFTYGDVLTAPNGREYTVDDVYVDAEGGTRVRLRHSVDRMMCRTASRLAHIVDNGDWSHKVADSQSESAASNSATQSGKVVHE